jgi:hypothetical protein
MATRRRARMELLSPTRTCLYNHCEKSHRNLVDGSLCNCSARATKRARDSSHAPRAEIISGCTRSFDWNAHQVGKSRETSFIRIVRPNSSSQFLQGGEVTMEWDGSVCVVAIAHTQLPATLLSPCVGSLKHDPTTAITRRYVAMTSKGVEPGFMDNVKKVPRCIRQQARGVGGIASWYSDITGAELVGSPTRRATAIADQSSDHRSDQPCALCDCPVPQYPEC